MRSCIQALANGWIGCSDLCPVCTTRFMAALDGLGEDLDWHPAFVERADPVTAATAQRYADATNAPITTFGGHDA